MTQPRPPVTAIDFAKGNGLVPVIGEMRHELIENASFVRMPAQIIEAAHIPGSLMRYPVGECHVQFAPGLP